MVRRCRETMQRRIGGSQPVDEEHQMNWVAAQLPEDCRVCRTMLPARDVSDGITPVDVGQHALEIEWREPHYVTRTRRFPPRYRIGRSSIVRTGSSEPRTSVEASESSPGSPAWRDSRRRSPSRRSRRAAESHLAPAQQKALQLRDRQGDAVPRQIGRDGLEQIRFVLREAQAQ